jgi:ribose-phosphate pyrophosphokinase
MAQQIRTLPFLESGKFAVLRYNNQELHAVVASSVSEKPCSILGSIAPPEEQILSFTLLAHTLKKEGARHVTGILPYLAYTREDKRKPGESLSAAWVGSLLKASGVDSVLTVDLHSERDKDLFPVPLVSLSPASLFAATISRSEWKDATIVAPDHGAISRCEAVQSAMGIAPHNIPYFGKRRTDAGIVHGKLVGEVGPRAIIIDDILDTGETLVSACERLSEAKVQEICIFITHGLFTGSHWKRLKSLGVQHIFCTDTVPVFANLTDENITVLSITPMLEKKLAASKADQPTS